MQGKFYVIEPEVAGGLGDQSIIDHSVQPFTVRTLHYEFEGWLGDELLATNTCYIVSTNLRLALSSSSYSGFSIDAVTVTKSELFEEMEPNLVLPDFYWLKIWGVPGIDDFGLASQGRLVVSDRALALLKKHSLNNCIVRRRLYNRS